MLVKKIGHTILVKTKAYKLIKLIAPLLIITTFALFLIVPTVTQNYQFQQPALKTKVSILEPRSPDDIPIRYSQIYPGVQLALIGGRLTGQTILLVANCGLPNKTTNQVFENVYQSISKVNKKQRRLLAKNVGFLCYNSSQSLHSFMRMQSGFSEPNPHKQGLEMGIIRNALFVELNQQIRKDRKQARIYFNQYSQQSELHVDLDYYQAIKQLLQQSGVTKWQPCSYLHSSKFLANLLKIGNKYINFGGRHLLCQFYQVFRRGKIRDNFLFKSTVKVSNKNYMFMQNGVQAATVQAWFPTQNKTDVVNKLSKVALGFLQEFVVLEDHLHSSSTLFVPVSQTKYIPLKGLIIPGLAFLVASAAHLILKAIYLMDQSSRIEQSKTEEQFLDNSLEIKLNKTHPIFIILMLILYLGSFEFYVNSTGYFTILIATIFKFMTKESLTSRQKELVRIFLAAFVIFMCEYAAIFCFPLSILLMIQGVLLIFTSRATTLFALGLGLSVSVYLSQLDLLAIGSQIINLSPMAQLCLYPIFIWGFIV